MQEKLKAIRDKIDTALEANGLDGTRVLKFGCKIKVENRNSKGNVIFISKGSYKTEKGFTLYDVNKQNEIIVEIHGRDITLEDVLFAVISNDDHYGVKALDYREPETVTFVKDGCYFSDNCLIDEVKKQEGYAVIEELDTEIEWKLTIPLHLQSPETIEFVYQLICKGDE